MMGRSHALSGAAAGAGAGVLALHLPPGPAAMFTVLTAGGAVLPDLDHPNASLARSFGFATRWFAGIVGKVSGGHRHGTHSIAGIGVFTMAMWSAVTFRHDIAGWVALWAMVTLLFAGALYALRLTGGSRVDVAAAGAALVVVWSGYGMGLAALATGLGCAVHIAGDMLTPAGCPLGWPLSERRYRLLPRWAVFTTGTRPERLIVVPAMLGALAWVAVLAMSGR